MSVDDLMDALFGDEEDPDGEDLGDQELDTDDAEVEEIEEIDLDDIEGEELDEIDLDDVEDEELVEIDLDEAEEEADDADDLVSLLATLVDDDEEDDFDEDGIEEYEIGGGVAASCPHCGEALEIFVDPAGGAVQDYVEDCSVCCRPSTVRVTVDKDGVSTVDLEPMD